MGCGITKRCSSGLGIDVDLPQRCHLTNVTHCCPPENLSDPDVSKSKTNGHMLFLNPGLIPLSHLTKRWISVYKKSKYITGDEPCYTMSSLLSKITAVMIHDDSKLATYTGIHCGLINTNLHMIHY